MDGYHKIQRFDYVLVGGGLANALIALALLDRDPGTRLAVVEKGGSFGGNHTWCFHDDDIAPDAAGFVEPLVVQRWPGYAVAFPGLERTLATGYQAVTSARLHDVLAARLCEAPYADGLTRRSVRSVERDHVVLDNGQRLDARLVVDARGPAFLDASGGCGYQKFLGLELALARPHPLTQPTLMDATVAQLDGFRFVYTLPLSPERVLVEDTYYSASPRLDPATLEARAMAYATDTLGLEVAGAVRREHGVLPLPMRAQVVRDYDGPLRAGYHGGWFHPTTGYSFPVAARLARHVASVAPEGVLGPELDRLALEHERQARFCTLLNRLLFVAVAPEQRWRVLARFYRLPEATIRRFYAMNTTAGDRARIVCGRPPGGLSLRAALAQGIAI